MGNFATGHQIANGVSWLMLFKILDRGLGFISTLILARILVPADFGLIAMASAVVALTQLMGAFGFDSALIQRQDARREHYDTAWTFNLIFGVGMAVLLLGLAVPAANFYREPRLELILPVLALGTLLGGLENIGTVDFRKHMDFASEFRFLLVKRLASFLVTVILAITFQTYWALVAGVVTGKLVAVIISYMLHPYRPRLSLAARDDLLHFSKWIFISNLIYFLHGRSTDFILGRTTGPHGLGVYSVAVDIASMPSTELIAPLNRAVYPAYARLSRELESLLERFKEVFGIICFIAFPASVGLASVADLVVRVLLGHQWLDAIPIIRVAAITGLIGALQSNLYIVIAAIGKPKANTSMSAMLLLIALPTIAATSYYYGALGAAYAHLTVAAIGFLGIALTFCRLTGMHLASVATVLWRPATSSIIMAAAVLASSAYADVFASDIVVVAKLAGSVSLGATVYTLTSLILWALSGRPSGAERAIFTIVAGKIQELYKTRLF